MNAALQIMGFLARSGGRTAICEPCGASITCQELLEKVEDYRIHFREGGLEAGHRVVLQVPNGVSLVALILGIIAEGGVPVLIEPGCGNEVYLSQVKATRPQWVVAHKMMHWVNRTPGLRKHFVQRSTTTLPPDLRRFEGVVNYMVLPLSGTGSKGDRRSPAGTSPAERQGDDEAVIVFTGGTTSEPKGVRLTHGSLRAFLDQVSLITREVPFTCMLAENPQQVLYALHLGKTACILKGSKKKRPGKMFHSLREGRVDACFSSPYMWIQMFEQIGASASKMPQNLKAVFLGGAPVTRDFLEKLNNRLHPATKVMVLYGMTETGPVCAIDGREKMLYQGEDDLVGQAFGTARIDILDPDARSGIGEVGVSGPSLFAGYLDEVQDRKADYFPTGDLGRFRSFNGKQVLTLMGRKKDMLIRRGVNIYPAQLEPLVNGIIDSEGRRRVQECALIGIWNDDTQDEEIILYLKLEDNVSLDSELKKLIKDVCGTEGQPDQIIIVDELPRVGRQSKVDKEALRAEVRSN